MTPFRVRDPIHGLIELSPQERAAMDTPCFQRLRSIGQLAMTHLVYPGARHSRFEHSLGVSTVAGRLAKEVELTENDVEVVRLAGLLHDIGHGPFSHVSENVLDRRAGVGGVHEAISVALMRTDSHLKEAVDREQLEQAAVLIAQEGQRSVQRDIVSGPTDADKLDYLLRDSYFAGVNYGKFDLDRLYDTAVAITPDEVESYLGFDETALWAVEELLLARHHMHRQVYGHKTRMATDIMIERALEHGLDEGALDTAAYEVPVVDGRAAPDEAFLEKYLRETDGSVIHALQHQENGAASRDLIDRLLGRQLLRRQATIALHEKRDDLGGPRLGRILDQERFGPQVEDLEAKIAEELGCPSYLVALKVIQNDNPTFHTGSSEVTAKDVLLQRRNGEPDVIQHFSEVFRFDSGEDRSHAYLYAPHSDINEDRHQELLWNALLSI